MSTNYLEEDEKIMMCCASCGIAEVDNIKLKKCNGCKSVRYCSVNCQKEHRPQHKKACKKRAAEIRDEILFQQPEGTDMGDCPICLLPLPIDDNDKTRIMGCCSKIICIGCDYSNTVRELEQSLPRKCPFCRHPMPKTEEEAELIAVTRVEANDPVALQIMGFRRYGEGDYNDAFQYWIKAAGLGNMSAHYHLSVMYRKGQGGVEKDMKKGLHHLEQAAIGGHLDARFILGCIEKVTNVSPERAVKHFVIAAKLGHDDSMKKLTEFFTMGFISKEELTSTLRAHQAAVAATKSPQREAGQEAARKFEAAKLAG
jgi:hypothetical protein